jgi:hypothetical protein
MPLLKAVIFFVAQIMFACKGFTAKLAKDLSPPNQRVC